MFTKTKMLNKGHVLVLVYSLLVPVVATAQDDVNEAAANAANPLADIAKIQGEPNFTWKDDDGRQVNVVSRFTIPTASAGLPFIRSKGPSKVYTIYRLEAPIISQTFPDEPERDATGLSDLILLDIIMVRQTWGLLGVGPVISIPVMKPEPVSIRKWGAGFALAALNTKTKGLQWGALAQQFFTFAGDSERPNQSFMLLQPILNVILGGGKFVQFSPVMKVNWTDETYDVPIGINFGKAFSRQLGALIGPEYVVSGPNKGDVTFQFQLNAMFPANAK